MDGATRQLSQPAAATRCTVNGFGHAPCHDPDGFGSEPAAGCFAATGYSAAAKPVQLAKFNTAHSSQMAGHAIGGPVAYAEHVVRFGISRPVWIREPPWSGEQPPREGPSRAAGGPAARRTARARGTARAPRPVAEPACGQPALRGEGAAAGKLLAGRSPGSRQGRSRSHDAGVAGAC